MALTIAIGLVNGRQLVVSCYLLMALTIAIGLVNGRQLVVSCYLLLALQLFVYCHSKCGKKQ